MRRSLAVLLLLLLTLPIPSYAQVAINLSSTTTLIAAPQKQGINNDPITNYDSGQIFKNLFFNAQNPGNEPQSIGQEVVISSGGTLTTTQIQTNTNDTDYDSVTPNQLVGATLTVYITANAPAPGSDVRCTGTITSNTAPQSNPKGAIYTISPACATTPVPGDVLSITQTISPSPSSSFGCVPVSQCAPVTTNLCAACGTQAVVMDGTSGSVTKTFQFDYIAQAPSGIQNFYQINGGTWTYANDAKTVSGNPVVQIDIHRAGGFSCSATLPASTSAWTHPSSNCNPTETNSGTPATIFANITVSGGAVALDNFDFEKTSGNDTTNTTLYADGTVAALRQLFGPPVSGVGPGTCRYGANPSMHSMTNLLQKSGNLTTTAYEGAGGFQYGAGFQVTTIPEFLNMAQTVGCTPHLILPIETTVQDMRNLMDYLGGGSGTTYGAIRIAQGYSATWTSVFGLLHLEFGNENWNGAFTSQTIGFRIGGTLTQGDYMGRCGTLIQAARAQASYSSNIKFMVGVQTAVRVEQASIALANPDEISFQGYYGNPLTPINGSSTPLVAADYVPLMTEAAYSMTHDPNDNDGFYQSMTAYRAMNVCGPSHSAACLITQYEGSIGTFEGTASQTQTDSYAAGGATAVTGAVSYLAKLQAGMTAVSLYALTGYDINSIISSTSTVYSKIWGIFLDPNARSIIRPVGLGAILANQCVIGPLYASSYTPDTYNLAANNAGVMPINGVPYEYAYHFKNGNNHTVCLVNIDTVNSHTVNFTGPDSPASGSTVTQTLLAPPSLGALNEASGLNQTNTTPATVALATNSITSFNPAAALTLPPYSAMMLSYNTSGSPSPAVSISASPSSIMSGTSSTLTVTASNASSVTVAGTDGSSYTLSSTGGTQTVSPNSTTTYTATAIGAGGSATSTAIVTVSTVSSLFNTFLNGALGLRGNAVIH